ncbi:hypothetical protein KMP13_09055 [Epibacterium ulvae]|uniref:NfeD family protein n=1 Tax=Epibacterium ulvae TaxID=1156985 RepID=UPI001BFC6775|nr:hypothetical protein [Epibacterium ulvae]MBT8154042.1 hypothetical protein [Epibacterium ulvae]
MPDAFWQIWWIWGVAALVLVGVEILVPGFIALGFGIGAAIIAALFFVVPETTVAPSLLALLFAILSLAAWLVLRRVFSLPTGQVKKFDHDIND